MADFSPSGLADLPTATADTLLRGDPRLVGWLKEAEDEGDRINREDPNYEHFDAAMRYVAGDQRQSISESSPRYLPRVVINESRKVVQAHVSTLTDLKPLFAFKASNDAFGLQASLINQRIVAWWIETSADLSLGDCIKYALVGGTGDLAVEYDPNLGPFGNNVFIAKDPRDTLPIRPSQERNLQLWQGLTLREELSINAMRQKFPEHQHLFTKPSADNILTRVKGRLQQLVSSLQRPVGDTLSALDQSVQAKPRLSTGGVVVRRTYLADHTRNLTPDPIPMGRAGSNWAYVVPPGGRLYPRKRLVVWTDDGILYDGPNSYWHSLYPLARLTLWDLPWQRLGISLINDTRPIQDAINDTANDLRVGLRKWMAPTVAFDRNAVSESFMKLYDPRKPNTRVKVNAGFGEGFRHLEGPNPQVLRLGLEFLAQLTTKHNDLSSVLNLEALLQLRQLPGADTIQRFHEAMTPQIRQEARQLEVFLRSPAEMVKVNLFQFESQAHRITLLGPAAVTLEDFDWDPDTVVPALSPGMPGYTKELDATLPREARAQFFHKLFVFMVAPNSLIALNAQEQKMMKFQLARAGYLDFWTLLEALEIGNVGAPPPIPLPPLKPPDPAEVLAELATPANPGGRYLLDPTSGQLLEIRPPVTITERLIAQSTLGIGLTVNPAGRKAAGESSPRTETKDGGTRPVTTESSES